MVPVAVAQCRLLRVEAFSEEVAKMYGARGGSLSSFNSTFGSNSMKLKLSIPTRTRGQLGKSIRTRRDSADGTRRTEEQRRKIPAQKILVFYLLTYDGDDNSLLLHITRQGLRSLGKEENV